MIERQEADLSDSISRVWDFKPPEFWEIPFNLALVEAKGRSNLFPNSRHCSRCYRSRGHQLGINFSLCPFPPPCALQTDYAQTRRGDCMSTVLAVLRPPPSGLRGSSTKATDASADEPTVLPAVSITTLRSLTPPSAETEVTLSLSGSSAAPQTLRF